MEFKFRTEATFVIMFSHLYKDVRHTFDIDIDLDVIYCPAWPSAEPTPGSLTQGGHRGGESSPGDLAQTNGPAEGGRA